MHKETRTFTTCTNCSKAIINPSILQKHSLGIFDNPSILQKYSIHHLYQRPVHADWRQRFNSESCQQSLEGLVEFENLGETRANSPVACYFCRRQTWHQQQLQACVLDI